MSFEYSDKENSDVLDTHGFSPLRSREDKDQDKTGADIGHVEYEVGRNYDKEKKNVPTRKTIDLLDGGGSIRTTTGTSSSSQQTADTFMTMGTRVA